MSWEAEAWARQQRTGDPVTKAVLVGIANWVNPRGDAAQVSLRRLGDEVEVSQSTVRRHVARLESLGFIEKTEQFREDGGSGWNQFRLLGYRPPRVSHATPPSNLTPPSVNAAGTPNLSRGDVKLEGGDGTDDRGGMAECNGEGVTADRGRSPSRNIISPPNPPSEADEPPKRGARISPSWEPPAISDLPNGVATIVRQWPAGAYEAEAEAFRDYWLGEGRAGARKLDWNRAWYNRIHNVAARVLRDVRAGVRFDAPLAKTDAAPMPGHDTCGEGEQARAIRSLVERAIGKRSATNWLSGSRFDINADELIVVAPSEFISSEHQSNFDAPIRRAMRAVLGDGAELHWRFEKPRPHVQPGTQPEACP
jgi:DNA-binding transcriptional ArsR family regulator